MFNGATAMTLTYNSITEYENTPDLAFFNVTFAPTNTQISAAITYYFDETDDDMLLTDNNKKEILAASGIGKWNTSSVSNMSSLFQNKTTFNENISDWDTSSTTDMSNMFNGATNFSQNISHWKLHATCVFTDMFTGTGMESYAYIGGYNDGNPI
jgi:surface protein